MVDHTKDRGIHMKVIDFEGYARHLHAEPQPKHASTSAALSCAKTFPQFMPNTKTISSPLHTSSH